MNTKNNLRKQTLKKRNSLSEKERLDAEKSLFQSWNAIKDSYKTDKVALYWAVKGEILTNSLINHFLEQGSECFFPVVSNNKANKNLDFAFFEKENPLNKNRFDIPEPNEAKIIDLNDLDIIFLPCVCFDYIGNRIGMGQGFYDQTLSKLSYKKETKLIILAYDFQEVESCMAEEHDIKADACLTPNQYLDFSQ